ncbi:ABC transporter ATP-binding protein [Methanosarcina siciliae]|uniref:ABC transporter ATP-binding protein n=1 Tax=Methanosarcina siciliae TaxID=38027 RepID=UPI00064FD98F|nr:ABC transporter ATP-binding protein [Methanosarcina siciliae]
MTSKNNSLHILYFLFRPHRKLLGIYFVSLLVFSFLDVLRVFLIYPLINYGLNINQNSTLIDRIYQSVSFGNLHPFLVYAIVLSIVSIIIAGVEVGVSYLGSKTFATVRDTTDRSVFNNLKNQPYEYFASHKQGDILYIGQQAVEQTGLAVFNVVGFLQNILFCLFYLSFIFILSFKISTLMLILGAIYVFFMKNIIFSRIYKHSLVLNRFARAKSVIYNEFISGIKTIFITDSIDFWAGNYNKAVYNIRRSYVFSMILQRLPGAANNLLIFQIIALGAAGLYYITDGHFLPYIGIFGTLLLALYRTIPALNACQSQFGTIVQQLPAIEAVYDFLQENNSKNTHLNNLPKREFRFQNSIIFKNVFFRYNDTQKYTIKNLSFTIKKSTKTAIVGNSGAGKTTIANLLALLYQPTSGEILVDEADLNEFKHSDYLKRLGYLGQETFIYHDSIKENIRFGLDCNDDEIIEAARLADAHEFIMSTSEGYDTIIGDQGIKLSGGQRQRIAIARIILRKPEILLLDEATSSLDNIAEQRVMESIDRISKDMTVITIAHRLSTVKNADVIYVLKEGEIVECGKHKELLELKGEYYNLYNKVPIFSSNSPDL